MLLPESMSRIMIVGTKSRMDDAINAFYSEKVIHVIDHTTGDDGLSIGSSNPSTSKASERLLKIRGLEKELGIKKKTKTEDIAVEEVRERVEAGDVETVEEEILSAVDDRNGLTQKISELNSKKQIFGLLSKLPETLTLDLYSGYKSISVMVGLVSADPSALKVGDSEVFYAATEKKKYIVAVFFRNEDREAVASALAELGYAEVQVPVTTEAVKPADEIAKIDAEIVEAEEDLEKALDRLLELKAKHRSFLKGSDEELSIEVQKGSVPLRIAVGKYSYIMDAWVPTDKVETVKKSLETKLGDDVHVEVMEEKRSRKMEDSESQEPRFQSVPTKQSNGRVAREFEYATSLVSKPKYQEIDPTLFIMIFLPLFFGLMVGDAGYAIPFIILGAYGLKKTHNKDWRSIAVVFFLGGIWAFLFGFFFYGEMLGMHFIGGNYINGEWVWKEGSIALGGTSVTWDWLLGHNNFPQFFMDLMAKTHSGHAAIGKLEDVSFLLKLSVFIGIFHLSLGHACGLYNKIIQHGAKHAFIEKGGVIFAFVGMILLCYGMTDFMFHTGVDNISNTALYVMVAGIVFMVVGTVINSKAEGALQAILGIPEHLGQILSYTRLAAIAMSKAGMALAFNFIIFSMIIPTGTRIEMIGGIPMEIAYFDPFQSIPMLILGILMFCFLHLVIWMLAILSAGIHSLRLQFVELMMRFFEGGGEEFAPLKEVRKKTYFRNKLDNSNEV